MSSLPSTERNGSGPRLIVWAPCTSPSTSHLPVLDPDSLYAATLLQARRGVHSYSISAPSPLFNSRIPCLEDASTGLPLADDFDSIDSYSSKHISANQGRIELEDDLVLEGENERIRWAHRKVLEQYLLRTLHPLIYQELFSQPLFHSHTSKIYQTGLPFLYRGSLVNRLRKELRLSFARRAQYMHSASEEELGAFLSESNTRTYLQQEEEREREILAERSGIHKDGKRGTGLAAFRGNGMLIEEKQKAARAFNEMRLKGYVKKVLDSIVEALGENQYLYESQKPSLLDLRLFSLLAPLLLPAEHYPSLTKSTLPSLIRTEYQTLVTCTERIQRLVWPIEVQTMLQSPSAAGSISRTQMCLTPGWPVIIGREMDPREPEESLPLAIRMASSLGTICGQAYRLTTYIFTSAPSTERKGKEKETEDLTKSEAEKVKKPAMTQAEKQDARRVTIGRWIWMTSAVIGIVATAFASGLLAIEVVDPERDTSEEAETIADRKDDDNISSAISLGDSKDAEITEDSEVTEDDEVDDEEYEMVEIDEELDEEGVEELSDSAEEE